MPEEETRAGNALRGSMVPACARVQPRKRAGSPPALGSRIGESTRFWCPSLERDDRAEAVFDESSPSMPELNPCLSCGACCASFRVSFHWSESESLTPAGVPAGLSRELDLHRLVMLGTEANPLRCVALEGAIGTAVRCSIYDRRPSVCREFEAASNPADPADPCNRARNRHGLPPLGRPLDDDRRDDPPEHMPPLPRAA